MPDVRKVLLAEVGQIPGDEVAVLLSGGIDSLACGLAARQLGKKVVSYSFTLNGHVSTDFQGARMVSREFGFEFRPVILPTDMPSLVRDLMDLADLGAKSKTDYECGWPVLRAIRQVGEPAIITGHGADGHFCISKKGMIHYKDTRIDEFRQGLFSNPRYAQQELLRAETSRLGKSLCLPFLSDAMVKEFAGTSWSDVNKPKQKQPILDAFPKEFARVKVRPHVNLQLGDSGIAQHFYKLLDTDLNTGGFKTPVGVYNRLTNA
jgi:asparagine synthetase B (glutamine-hydrolysing)